MPEQADTASDSVAATPDKETMAAWLRSLPAKFGEKEIIPFDATMVRRIADELEGMTKNRDNLREYLGEAKDKALQSERGRLAAVEQAEKARAILRAVIAEATRPSAEAQSVLAIPPGKRDAQQAAIHAVWHQSCLANAVRFVAELATMTDIECEFLDGHELRSIAQLLQVPDDESNRAPTVPRLYSDEDRDRAISALSDVDFPHSYQEGGELIDAIAEALGMRKAGA